MRKLSNIRYPSISRNLKVVLWVLLIALTLIILSAHTHLPSDFHMIQTLYIFDNLPLFTALYCIWVLLLLFLLFLPGGDGEKIGIVLIFVLIYLVFWTTTFSHGRAIEEYTNGLFIRYLGEGGRLSPPHEIGIPHMWYPGFHILASSISQITGLDVFPYIARMMSIFVLFLFGMGLYLLFKNILQSGRLGAFATLLFIQGSQVVGTTYPLQARYWGLAFFPLLTMLALSKANYTLPRIWKEKFVLILLFLAFTITHATSFFFAFSILGLYLVNKISSIPRFSSQHVAQQELNSAQYKGYQGAKREMISLSTVILASVIFIGWEIYFAKGTFRSVIIAGEENIMGGLIDVFLPQEKFTVGARMPLWANWIRFFWWVLLIGVGGILGIRRLINIKRLSLIEKEVLGCLIGVAMASVILVAVSEKGIEYYRLLYFLPFFTIPILIRFLFFRRKKLFIPLVILFFILSFPTFLIHNSSVPLEAVRPEEVSTANFLKSLPSEEESPTIFCSFHRDDLYRFYNSSAHFSPEYALDSVYPETGQEFQQRTERVITRLEKSKGERDNIFVLCKRTIFRVERVSGVQPTHPTWTKLNKELSRKDKIYENGFTHMYRF